MENITTVLYFVVTVAMVIVLYLLIDELVSRVKLKRLEKQMQKDLGNLFMAILKTEIEQHQPQETTEPEDLPKFTFEGYKRGDFVVNLRTQEEADLFADYLDKKGEGWRGGESYKDETYWLYNKENTCYNGKGKMYASVDFYKEKNKTVIPFNADDLD